MAPPSATRCRAALAQFAFVVSLLPAAESWGGSPVVRGEELQVNTLTEGIQQSAAVAMGKGGDFVVAWQSEVAGRGDEIRARRFAAGGAALGEEIAVNVVTAGNQNAPAIAIDRHGAFVVTWQSFIANNVAIRARRFDSQGLALGDEIAVTTSRGDTHSAPAVAMDAAGAFVVAWETAWNGSYEIRARRFAAHGGAPGGPIAVNTVTLSSQRVPAVAMDEGGDFVVVWRSNVGGSFEIRARRFSASGQAQSGEIAVNTVKLGDQLAPAVAMDAQGDFVVAWENSFDGGFEIRARRFSASGQAPADEMAVNPQSAGNQFAPAVAMDEGGDFVVAWHALVQGSYEIRARDFAASGLARTGEIAINALTAGTQKSAAVAMGADDGFVVAWHSDAQGSWEVAARCHRPSPGGASARAPALSTPSALKPR